MDDKVVSCVGCGEPFLVCADEESETIQMYCDACKEHFALEFCRTYKE